MSTAARRASKTLMCTDNRSYSADFGARRFFRLLAAVGPSRITAVAWTCSFFAGAAVLMSEFHGPQRPGRTHENKTILENLKRREPGPDRVSCPTANEG